MLRGEVNVRELAVSIGGTDTGASLPCLRINGRPVPIEQYEMIPEESLDGDPLGWVNLHGETCQARDPNDHLHLLWVNGNGELRVSTVTRDHRWEELRQIFVGD